MKRLLTASESMQIVTIIIYAFGSLIDEILLPAGILILPQVVRFYFVTYPMVYLLYPFVRIGEYNSNQ